MEVHHEERLRPPVLRPTAPRSQSTCSMRKRGHAARAEHVLDAKTRPRRARRARARCESAATRQEPLCAGSATSAQIAGGAHRPYDRLQTRHSPSRTSQSATKEDTKNESRLKHDHNHERLRNSIPSGRYTTTTICAGAQPARKAHLHARTCGKNEHAARDALNLREREHRRAKRERRARASAR